MKMITQEQAKHITDKVLSLSKADQCEVTLTGGRSGNIRFARNAVSTAGEVNDISLAISVAYGKKQGTITLNELDDASLAKGVQRAQDLAKLAPDNPEFMPAVGKQHYAATPTFVQATQDITPEYRTEVARLSIETCKKKGLVAAGFFIDNAGFECNANSNGMFGFATSSNVNFTLTSRTEDGRGSGWVTRGGVDVRKFDAKLASEIAVEKAMRSVEAKALEPGRYTVILEPSAASGLIAPMFFAFDARSADEGRSFLAKKGGGTRLGEKLFDERVQMIGDPSNVDVPALPWDGSGLARGRQELIKDGKINYLYYSRYWASQKKVEATAQPGNIIMVGGNKSTADLIAATKKGILVTRTWYIRMVDPQSQLVTGLTRDGTFYIEDGKIKYPIKNFRFNESPVTMLNNIEEFGKSEIVTDDDGQLSMLIPPMKIRDFNFTSLSDAV